MTDLESNMKITLKQSGYSLIELMITVGIVAVLAAIAVPAYDGFVSTSKIGVAKQNAKTLAGFEDTYFYENDSYLAGTHPAGGPNGLAALGWAPLGDDNMFNYTVTADPCGDITACYTVTVTHKDDSTISETITIP